MYISVYDPLTINLLGQIDVFSSLDYKRQYIGSGDFTIVCPYNSESESLLKRNNYITLESDGHRAGIIKGVKINENDATLITITGKTLSWLLTTRCNIQAQDVSIASINYGYDLMPQYQHPGTTLEAISGESIIKGYVDRHMITPEDNKRVIPRLINAPDLHRGEKYKWLAENGANLADTAEKICKYFGFGYEIYLDSKNKYIVFEIIMHNERSGVVFSAENANITSGEYQKDDSAYKNAAYAAGKKYSDLTRVMTVQTQEPDIPCGLERAEVFFDCGEMQSVETDREISIQDEAKRQISDYTKTETYTATPINIGQYIYLKDYDIGAHVGLSSVRLGISTETLISSIQESYSESGDALTLGFGNLADGAADVIKKIIRRTV